MSDKKTATGKLKADSPVPTARRISNPRPKKASNKSTADSPDETASGMPGQKSADSSPPQQPVSAAEIKVEAVHDDPQGAPANATSDWPEPEAPITGGQGSPDGKRKRRRRKGKGQSTAVQTPTAPITEEIHSFMDAVEPSAGDLPKQHRPPQASPQVPRQQPGRAKIDPETLSNKAWKIFLAEVSEEGVALIGDQDARELARRCFRLAEIFIEEQSRRLSGGA